MLAMYMFTPQTIPLQFLLVCCGHLECYRHQNPTHWFFFNGKMHVYVIVYFAFKTCLVLISVKMMKIMFVLLIISLSKHPLSISVHTVMS